VLVAALRRKLARLQYAGQITSVRGQGYRFEPARGVSARPTPRLRRPHRLGSSAGLVVQAEPPYTLWAGSRSAQLSPSEARVLALLRQEAGQIIAHARLATAVSGNNTVSRNNLHVYVMRLRQRLHAVGSPWQIRTLHNRGYVLELPTTLGSP